VQDRSVDPILSGHIPTEQSNQTGLVPGSTLPPSRRAALAKKLGRDLPEEVWSQHLTGHRLLVVPEPVSERTAGGVLFKPRSTVKRQELEMGAGWVIAVGPLVGQPGAPHPGGLMCLRPEDALGAHVLYKQYSGTNLKVSEEDTEFEGNLIVLTDRDCLAWTPDL
jgi:co-chaperonin GroES (HSP10)